MSDPAGIRDAGIAMLDMIIADVTGDPSELRAKAQECRQAATDTEAAATDTDGIITTLGSGWHGKSYDSCKTASGNLTEQLRNQIKRGLEEEAQRLDSSASALDSAKSQAQQQKQDFAMKAAQTLLEMAAKIAAAMARTPPDMAAVAAAIAEAVSKMLQLKSEKQGEGERIKNDLSKYLTGLYQKAGQSQVPAR